MKSSSSCSVQVSNVAEPRIAFRIRAKSKPKPVLVFEYDSSSEGSDYGSEVEDDRAKQAPEPPLPKEPPPPEEPPPASLLPGGKAPFIDENGNKTSTSVSWDDDLHLESLDDALKRETEKIGQWNLDEMEVLSVWQPERDDSEEPASAPPLPDYSPAPPPPPPPGGDGCDDELGEADMSVVDMVLSGGEDDYDGDAAEGLSDDLNVSTASTLSRRSLVTVDGQSPHRDLTRPPTRTPSPSELLFGTNGSPGRSCSLSPDGQRGHRGRHARSRSRSPTRTRRGRGGRNGRGRGSRSPWRGSKRGRSSSSSSSYSASPFWRFKPCNLCLVHGVLSRYAPDHKFDCPYFSCCCDECIISIVNVTHRPKKRFLPNTEQILSDIYVGIEDATVSSSSTRCLYCANHGENVFFNSKHIYRYHPNGHCDCDACLSTTVVLRARAATTRRSLCEDCYRHGDTVDDGAMHSRTCPGRNCDGEWCCGDRGKVRRQARAELGLPALPPLPVSAAAARRSRWDMLTPPGVEEAEDWESTSSRDPRLAKRVKVELKEGFSRRDPPQEAAAKDQPQEAARKDSPQKAARKDPPQESVRRDPRHEAARRDPRHEAARRDPRHEAARRDPRHEAARKDSRHEAAPKDQRHEAVLEDLRHEATPKDSRHEAVRRDHRQKELGDMSKSLGSLRSPDPEERLISGIKDCHKNGVGARSDTRPTPELRLSASTDSSERTESTSVRNGLQLNREAKVLVERVDPKTLASISQKSHSSPAAKSSDRARRERRKSESEKRPVEPSAPREKRPASPARSPLGKRSSPGLSKDLASSSQTRGSSPTVKSSRRTSREGRKSESKRSPASREKRRHSESESEKRPASPTRGPGLRNDLVSTSEKSHRSSPSVKSSDRTSRARFRSECLKSPVALPSPVEKRLVSPSRDRPEKRFPFLDGRTVLYEDFAGHVQRSSSVSKGSSKTESEVDNARTVSAVKEAPEEAQAVLFDESDEPMPEAPPPPMISDWRKKVIVNCDDLAKSLYAVEPSVEPKPPTPEPPEPPTPDPPAPPSPDPPTPPALELAPREVPGSPSRPPPCTAVVTEAAPGSEQLQTHLPAVDAPTSEVPLLKEELGLLDADAPTPQVKEVAEQDPAEVESVAAISAFIENTEPSQPTVSSVVEHMPYAKLQDILDSLCADLPEDALATPPPLEPCDEMSDEDPDDRDSPVGPPPAPLVWRPVRISLEDSLDSTPALSPSPAVDATMPPAVPLPMHREASVPSLASPVHIMPSLVPVPREAPVRHAERESASPPEATPARPRARPGSAMTPPARPTSTKCLSTSAEPRPATSVAATPYPAKLVLPMPPSATPPSATPPSATPPSATPPSASRPSTPTPSTKAVPVLSSMSSSGVPPSRPLIRKAATTLKSSNHASRSPDPRPPAKHKTSNEFQTSSNEPIPPLKAVMRKRIQGIMAAAAHTPREVTPKMCLLCRNHGKSSSVRGNHKRECPYKDCSCNPCRDTERKHKWSYNLISQTQASGRSVSSSNMILCRRCQIHKVSLLELKVGVGHECSYQNCTCKECIKEDTDMRCGKPNFAKLTSSSSDDSDSGNHQQSMVSENSLITTLSESTASMKQCRSKAYSKDVVVYMDSDAPAESEEDDLNDDDEDIHSDCLVIDESTPVESPVVSEEAMPVDPEEEDAKKEALKRIWAPEKQSKTPSRKSSATTSPRVKGATSRLSSIPKEDRGTPVRHCGFCRNHNIITPLRGHKKHCHYKGQCTCTACVARRAGRMVVGVSPKAPPTRGSGSGRGRRRLKNPRFHRRSSSKPNMSPTASDSESDTEVKDKDRDLDETPLRQRLKSLKKQDSDAAERSLSVDVFLRESSQAIDKMLELSMYSPTKGSSEHDNENSKSDQGKSTSSPTEPEKLTQSSDSFMDELPDVQCNMSDEKDENDNEKLKSDQVETASSPIDSEKVSQVSDNDPLDLVNKCGPSNQLSRKVLLPPIRIPEITAPGVPALVTPVADCPEQDVPTPIDLSVSRSTAGLPLTTPVTPTSPEDLSTRMVDSLALVTGALCHPEPFNVPPLQSSSHREACPTPTAPTYSNMMTASTPPASSMPATTLPVTPMAATAPLVTLGSAATTAVTSATTTTLPDTPVSSVSPSPVTSESATPSCVTQGLPAPPPLPVSVPPFAPARNAQLSSAPSSGSAPCCTETTSTVLGALAVEAAVDRVPPSAGCSISKAASTAPKARLMDIITTSGDTSVLVGPEGLCTPTSVVKPFSALEVSSADSPPSAGVLEPVARDPRPRSPLPLKQAKPVLPALPQQLLPRQRPRPASPSSAVQPLRVRLLRRKIIHAVGHPKPLAVMSAPSPPALTTAPSPPPSSAASTVVEAPPSTVITTTTSRPPSQVTPPGNSPIATVITASRSPASSTVINAAKPALSSTSSGVLSSPPSTAIIHHNSRSFSPVTPTGNSPPSSGVTCSVWSSPPPFPTAVASCISASAPSLPAAAVAPVVQPAPKRPRGLGQPDHQPPSAAETAMPLASAGPTRGPPACPSAGTQWQSMAHFGQPLAPLPVAPASAAPAPQCAPVLPELVDLESELSIEETRHQRAPQVTGLQGMRNMCAGITPESSAPQPPTPSAAGPVGTYGSPRRPGASPAAALSLSPATVTGNPNPADRIPFGMPMAMPSTVPRFPSRPWATVPSWNQESGANAMPMAPSSRQALTVTSWSQESSPGVEAMPRAKSTTVPRFSSRPSATDTSWSQEHGFNAMPRVTPTATPSPSAVVRTSSDSGCFPDPEAMRALGLVCSPPPSPCTPPPTPNLALLEPQVQMQEFQAFGPVVVCDICGLVLSSARELSEHRLGEHVTATPQPCSICGLTFYENEYAELHYQQMHRRLGGHEPPDEQLIRSVEDVEESRTRPSHVDDYLPNIRPFVCNESPCTRAFATRELLQKHRAGHVRRNDQHRCNVCIVRFNNRLQLEAHKMSSHSSLRPYKCPICARSLKTEGTLRIHMKSYHEDSKAFSCLECGEAFHLPKQLMRHASESQHMMSAPREAGQDHENDQLVGIGRVICMFDLMGDARSISQRVAPVLPNQSVSYVPQPQSSSSTITLGHLFDDKV